MYVDFYKDYALYSVGIKKEIENEGLWKNAPYLGAFSADERVRFSVSAPRKLGVFSIVLRINSDGDEYKDIPLDFTSIEDGNDVYATEISASKLGINKGGLLFYEFLLLRGEHTLFTSSINNSDFELKTHSDRKFSLLIYRSDFSVPKWFGNGIMYHIFVDRFAKGDVEPTGRDDIEINDDWENGIPQFAQYQGAPLKNNMFFGGNLVGICDKLDYIASLGTSVIYLSPIFKAYSNHKYDTGDYSVVDDMFGGEDALLELIEKAGKRGIKIILDGVFNHTGDDSLYFNKYGKYPSVGAYQSDSSPYSSWYTFSSFPDKYEAWWGIEILPKLNLKNEDCADYFVGDGGIIEKYTKMGIGGWRLDVADELPDHFLERIRSKANESSNGNAVIIGEVWENAAVKVSYGKRRKYFWGSQLDSVMNYPLKNGIVDFVRYGDADALYNVLTELYSSYPKCVCNSLMNILGTHDTERILTVLGGDEARDATNAELSTKRMNDTDRARAIRYLKIASVLQYTAFGIPSVFYGDEVGMEGYHDPFCRRPFPWGNENYDILEYYKKLGMLRLEETALIKGDFDVLEHGESTIAFERYDNESRICIAANRSDGYYILKASGKWVDLFSGNEYEDELIVPKDEAKIFKKIK